MGFDSWGPNNKERFMKFKGLVSGFLLTMSLVAFGVGTSYADNQTIDLSSGAASFVSTGTVLGGGQDVITFTNLAIGTYNFDFTMSSQYSTITNVFVNNQAAQQMGWGSFRFFGLSSLDTSPFTVTILGTGTASSLYSGELQVTRASVPEPSTFLLMFLGMGVAYIVSRRQLA
jgi:hypothetical protein